jgi:hypothetical protein
VKTNSTKDPEFLAAMGALMQESTRTDQGLHALAESVVSVVKMEIDRKNIVPLVLTETQLKAGEESKHAKRRGQRAHYIGVGGQPHRQEVNQDEIVHFPIFRLHSNPSIDVTDLDHGNVGKLTELQTEAASEIRNKLNAKVVTLLSAAAALAPSTNVVTISGGKLTDVALGTVISRINDLELNARWILLRGGRLIDLKDFNLDPESRREFIEKGVLNRFGGAGLLNTASMNANEVIILPDHEIGKYDIRTPLKVDPQKSGFRVGFLTYHECAMGITRPDLVHKVVITA